MKPRASGAKSQKLRTRSRNFTSRSKNSKGEIKQKDLENQELSQSLTMARRHSQQTETRVADLRAQMNSRQTQQTESAKKAIRYERAYNAGIKRVRKLQKNLVAIHKKLLRFEDRIRFQIQLEKDMKAQLERERRRGIVEVRRAGDRVVISISSAILFKSGSAKVRSESKALLVKFSSLLRRYANREVQVQGHTDNVQISDRLSERWETNWELSAARATRVLRYFVEVGNLDPRRVSGAGNGRVSFGRRQQYAQWPSGEPTNRNRHLSPRFLRGEPLSP